jgi:hypothetical protein
LEILDKAIEPTEGKYLMILPSYKRLNKSDYPKENQDLVDRLANSLNIGLESLYQLGNHNISLKDNMLSVTRDITVTVDSTGKPTTSTAIVLGNNVTQPIGTIVLLAINQTNSSIYPTGAPFISFTQTGTNIVVNNITGLPANNQFLLRVVVFG